MEKERSLSDSPSWAVATVLTVMIAVGFLVNVSLKWCGKWLDTPKRKALLSALEKIKDELMLFGFLSLLMGHWTNWVAKICVKRSALSSQFHPCIVEDYINEAKLLKHMLIGSIHSLNQSVQKEEKINQHDYCSEGLEPFALYESLEQLHRLIFVLAITHVSYSFITIALAMLKIHNWKTWENQAKSMTIKEGSTGVATGNCGSCMSTFIFHHTSHPWSQHKFLVWMLCFFRQFWSSINKADYMALRLGFLTNHGLHLSYDFHSYILRSMEDEFRDIVGISVPLWIYAILCIFLDFHGAEFYFWLSFTPAIFILTVGTKMHRIVVKLAVEIMDVTPSSRSELNLRDELFWFRNPIFLLQLIKLISFQNAFEMATFIWSLWEIRGTSCFMRNHVHLVIRLTSGVIFQFWCSYITLPLYVIITQMGSKFRKSVLAENVRRSLHEWSTRVKEKSRQNHSPDLMATRSSNSWNSMLNEIIENDNTVSVSMAGHFSRFI